MSSRRLAAILAADVVGFSAAMEADEAGTIAQMRSLHEDVVQPSLTAHQGRLVKTTGDGFLVEFTSALQAVCAAEAIQSALADSAWKVRIGINLGDIVIEPDGDILGDGVNVAARLEGLCDPGGILVSGKVYDEVHGKTAVRFEDRGEQVVKNMQRPVRTYAAVSAASTGITPSGLPPALPDQPSLAVLPFANLSGDVEQEYFVDGMVDELITALCRVKWFFVIARSSSFTYKGKAVDVRKVGRELGVRYVLEGSVRKGGGRVRISGQLVDTASGRQLWADKFDGDLSDTFELQDRITESVVGVLEPSLRAAEIARSRQKPTAHLGAYDLYLRGLNSLFSMTGDGLDAAARFATEALQLDPSFALAMALRSWAVGVRWSFGDRPAEDAAASVRDSRHAMAMAPDDANVLRIAGHVFGYCGKDYEAAIDAIDRALGLNPSSATAYSSSSWVRLYVGEAVVAEEHAKRSLRLSPLDPERSVTLAALSLAAQMQGEKAEALRIARQAVRGSSYMSAQKALLVALVQMGELEEARAEAQRVLARSPGFTVARQKALMPFRDPDFSAQFLEAFRAAGIPEGG
jgi:adenylate cyclase